MTETGATSATTPADTASETDREQSEKGETDAGAAAKITEKVMMTTAGKDGAELHTDEKESSATAINGDMNNADVETIHRDQPLTSVGAEMQVKRQEPMTAGNKGYEDVQEYTAGTDDLGIIDSQVLNELMV